MCQNQHSESLYNHDSWQNTNMFDGLPLKERERDLTIVFYIIPFCTDTPVGHTPYKVSMKSQNNQVISLQQCFALFLCESSTLLTLWGFILNINILLY
jgi:hypothetical protein